MSLVHTVGHSTKTFADFLALLRSAGITALVDVRRFPGSRRYPHFNSESLSQSLRAEGIDYVHAPELGGRRSADPDSRNPFWRNASFRAYADYMGTPEFESGLERLMQLAAHSRAAVMCSEAVPWRCHRQLIADALVARGHDVEHILTEMRRDPHVLNPGAVILPDKHVIYPLQRSEQATLFEPGSER